MGGWFGEHGPDRPGPGLRRAGVRRAGRPLPARAAGALLPDPRFGLDAEDALQETLLAAWKGPAGFEGRSSVRAWLFQIATRRCLNALRSAGRRP